MKKSILLFSVAIFTTLAACKQNDNKSELEKKTEKFGDAASDLAKETGKAIEEKAGDVKESMAQAGDDLKAAREQTKKDIQSGIDEINDKIKEMDAKMEKAADKQKANWKIQKQKLIATRDRLDKQMSEAGKDMKDGWNAFTSDVKKTLNEVKNDLKN